MPQKDGRGSDHTEERQQRRLEQQFQVSLREFSFVFFFDGDDFWRWCDRNFIQAIESNLFTPFSDVYSICVAYPDPLADRLYSETKIFLETHVDSQLVDFEMYMKELNDTESSQNQLLHKYYSAWKNYSQGLEYLNFLYL